MVGGNQNEGLLICGGIIQGFPNSQVKQKGLPDTDFFLIGMAGPVNLAALNQEEKGLLGLAVG